MTTRAKLPGLPAPNFADPAVQRWAQAVSERLEVREGARGDPLERVVTWRDLDQSFGGATAGRSRVSSPSVLSGTAQIPTGNGQTINIDMEAFSEQLKSTQLYRDLQFSINDPNRFARLGAEVNEFLTRSLTAETAARSAQIARTDIKLLELSRSVAATSVELTAALDTTAAGLRSTQFAIATESGATAGQVTTLEARLQVEVNPEDLLPVPPAAAYANLAALIAAVPAASADTRKYYRVAGTPEDLYRSNGTTYSLVGTEESAKLEEVLLVTADKSLGLEAQYTLKVNAGNAIAGFGIAATERDGVPESAFIIQADKFALSTPFTFSQELTPTATAVGQTWYQPSTKVSYRATAVGTGGWVVYTPIIPFGVDTTTGNAFVSGSLRVGGSTGLQMTSLETGVVNFNTRNDRNGAAIVTPVIATDGTAVDHVIRTDGSADISLEWSWAGNNADIDGWLIRVYVNSDGAPYTFGSNPAAESEYYLSAEKRALIGYGYPADVYYKFGVQAYRVVDPDVSAGGVIKSTLVVPSLGAENPYRPAANIAFAGNITGTINGTAAATVVSGAANGTTALNAVNDPTTGLAAKLASASRNVLAGSGGLAVGTINWNTSGVVNSGFGVAITANGIVARNSSFADTFVLDATTGNAVFKGDLTGASGTFSGSIITANQLIATGSGSVAGFNAAVIGNATTAGVLSILGYKAAGATVPAVLGYSASSNTGSAGVYGQTAVLGVPAVVGLAGAFDSGGLAGDFAGNVIVGSGATNTGIYNLIIKEGTAGSRLDNQMIIYGALSTDADTTIGVITEQGVVAGTGAFTGILQIRIAWNGAEYWLPLQAV